MKTELDENSLLSKLNFITSFGDWVCYFGFMYFIFEQTHSIALATSVVTIKAGSWLIASLTYPTLSNKFSVKSMLYFPQIACGLLALALIWMSNNLEENNFIFLFILLSTQSLLKEIFALSRDSYSKILRKEGSHMTLQAQLLNSNFMAQVLGPAFTVLVVKHISLNALLLIDSISFFVTAFLAQKLKSSEFSPEKRHLLAPLSYLHKKPALLKLFLLRAIVFWIGAGISNFMGVGQVFTQYKHNVVDSAWTYVTNALGAVVILFFLKNPKFRNGPTLSNLSNVKLACIGACIMALGRGLFAYIPFFWIGVAIWFFSGIGMGTLAAGSQTLRSELTTNKEFTEIVCLESVLGKCVDFLTQLICAYLISNGLVSTQSGLLFACAIGIASGILYLTISDKEISRTQREI